MKRLFGIICTLGLLCAAYGRMVFQEESKLQPIKYCNVGPLAAVNFSMHCLQVVKHNAHNLKVLETHAGVTERQEQLQALLKTYKKAPNKLQVLKCRLCTTLGLAPREVQIKLDNENSVCTNTMLKIVSVDKNFVRKPYIQQLGVLRHEFGHMIHNDCEAQINFDIASSYMAAIGTFATTFALHVPHAAELAQPVAEIAQAAYSRFLERRADSVAAQDPQAAQGLLEYLQESAQHDQATFTIFDTHPAYQERIAYLKQFVA